jgi:ABC-type nickel/cobalt efflux system permease component RcnA
MDIRELEDENSTIELIMLMLLIAIIFGISHQLGPNL